MSFRLQPHLRSAEQGAGFLCAVLSEALLSGPSGFG